MIISFYEFIKENLNYNLFKGVKHLEKILEDKYLKPSGEWESNIRKNLNITHGISASRNFTTCNLYGEDIIEFDVLKLTRDFKVVPFCENPDFYTYMKNLDSDIEFKRDKEFKTSGNFFKDAIRSKDKNDRKAYWDYKTNKYSMDFGIAEEIIVTEKLPISYFKKVYISEYNKKEKIKLLEKNNIKWEFIESKFYSFQKYKDKLKTKKYA
jgi:hypothetical protein